MKYETVANKKLLANYPNPFNGHTTLQYNLTETGHVVLKIYNSIGQELETLVNGMQSGGMHIVIWKPEELPSGLYFYKLAISGLSSLSHGRYIETGKMMLMK